MTAAVVAVTTLTVALVAAASGTGPPASAPPPSLEEPPGSGAATTEDLLSVLSPGQVECILAYGDELFTEGDAVIELVAACGVTHGDLIDIWSLVPGGDMLSPSAIEVILTHMGFDDDMLSCLGSQVERGKIDDQTAMDAIETCDLSIAHTLESALSLSQTYPDESDSVPASSVAGSG